MQSSERKTWEDSDRGARLFVGIKKLHQEKGKRERKEKRQIAEMFERRREDRNSIVGTITDDSSLVQLCCCLCASHIAFASNSFV